MKTTRTAQVLAVDLVGECRWLNGLQSILKASTDPAVSFCTSSPLAFVGASSAAARVAEIGPEIVFAEVDGNCIEGARDFLSSLRLCSFTAPVIVVGAGRPRDLVALMQAGAADYVVPPLQACEVLPRLWRWTAPGAEDELTRRLKRKHGLSQFVGRDPVFLREVEKIPRLAACEAGVLIAGETGTGKELAARALHYLSPRSSAAFVPVNCGALPVELAENELFGHEKGAFTGALNRQAGLIEEARGGTLFLDDVDCLPPAVQTKLLRFLQEGEFRALGSSKLRLARVRVVAASNRDLRREMEAKRFRADLFYRLGVVRISLPPLRTRNQDVLLLARHFLKRFASEMDRPINGFTPAAVRELMLYGWPGNVRELKHVIQRAVIFGEGPALRAVDLDLPLRRPSGRRESFREAKARLISEFERRYLKNLLLACQGNISEAARTARKNRRALFELLRKHGIDAAVYRRR